MNLNKNKNNRQEFHAPTKNVTLSNLYLILLQVLLSFCQKVDLLPLLLNKQWMHPMEMKVHVV